MFFRLLLSHTTTRRRFEGIERDTIIWRVDRIHSYAGMEREQVRRYKDEYDDDLALR